MSIVKNKKKAVIKNDRLPGILDVISPTVLEFHPKSLQMGELLQRTIVITDFPPRVRAGWLSDISTMPGVVASLHTYPTDSYDLVEQITIVMGELAGKLAQGGNPAILQRTKDKYKDAEALLKKIDREQQHVMFLVCVLLVSAYDQETLNQRTRRIESKLAASGMRGRTLVFKQEEAFRSVGPWAILEDDIKNIGARNMPSESVAAAYPFVFSGLNDGTGVLLGTDRPSNGIVLLDVWKREGSRTNSNMTVIGKPGMGKSTAIRKIIKDEYANGTRIIMIDPEREYKDLCENLKGDWVDCGGGAKGRINPLQVRNVPIDLDEEEEGDKYSLYSEELVQRGPLALHFQTLRTFFKLYLQDITKIDQAMIEEALEEVYINKFNITWTTDPKSIPNDRWPIIKDLYEHILTEKIGNENIDADDKKSWKKIASLLRSAAIGPDSTLFGGHTTIEANSDFVCLDIHRLLETDPEIRTAQFFNVLGWAWQETSKDRTEKVILGVDEAYLLVDPENPQPLQFLRNTSKRIRKYEGGLMVITHSLVDFLDPAVIRHGQALVDNPVYKLIMGQGDKDVEALERLMTLSEKELQTIAEGIRGEAILVAGDRRVHVKIEITEYERALFGSGGGR